MTKQCAARLTGRGGRGCGSADKGLDGGGAGGADLDWGHQAEQEGEQEARWCAASSQRSSVHQSTVTTDELNC